MHKEQLITRATFLRQVYGQAWIAHNKVHFYFDIILHVLASKNWPLDIPRQGLSWSRCNMASPPFLRPSATFGHLRPPSATFGHLFAEPVPLCAPSVTWTISSGSLWNGGWKTVRRKLAGLSFCIGGFHKWGYPKIEGFNVENPN